MLAFLQIARQKNPKEDVASSLVYVTSSYILDGTRIWLV